MTPDVQALVERLKAKLLEIENHCPCGARPELPKTHPHVGGCPVSDALELVAALALISSSATLVDPWSIEIPSAISSTEPHGDTE